MALERRRLLHVAAIGGAVLAGCSGTGDGGGDVPNTSDIEMVDSQFDPRNTHVDAGTEVTWSNADAVPHTVTNASDNWELDVEVGGGAETSHTFESDGVYDVYCEFHGASNLSGMSMKIAVGDATIESPLGGGGGGAGGY